MPLLRGTTRTARLPRRSRCRPEGREPNTPGLVGARGAEQVPGVRAPGGRRARAVPRPLDRGARRRPAGARRRGLAPTLARRARSGLRARLRLRERGQGRRCLAHAFAFAARLAAGAASGPGGRAARRRLPPLRLPGRRASRRQPRGARARRARADLPVRKPCAVRVPDRPARARDQRLPERSPRRRAQRSRPRRYAGSMPWRGRARRTSGCTRAATGTWSCCRA